ncbi:hypothetical protein C9374_009289 [Naegleria lovaniensis]|uniref:Uncharacterized protein n=1 Tax=Naegleria lovaniensis TaxID=51637 RepID=A0AA88GJR4_NAELO|nr:uncharacterized protein C9374_009289 [Naegleria lovaniensis]KAG2377378.1 hypothetical protein C9374_009289 [Naegleria lovaniensis]
MPGIQILKGRKPVKALAFNPKGKLACGTVEGNLKIFNDFHEPECSVPSSASNNPKQPSTTTPSSSREIDIKGSNRGDVTKIKFNPCCSHQLACITSKGYIRIFDTKITSYNGGESIVHLMVGDTPLKHLDWCCNGLKMVVVDIKNSIYIYTIKQTHATNIGEITTSSSLVIKDRGVFPCDITDIKWDKQGNTLYIATGIGKIFCVNDEKEKINAFVTLKINSPSVSTQPSQLLTQKSSLDAKSSNMMDTSSDEIDSSSLNNFLTTDASQFLVSKGALTSMDISSDEKYLVVGSEDSVVSIFEFPELICAHTFSDMNSLVVCVSVRAQVGTNPNTATSASKSPYSTSHVFLPPVMACCTRNEEKRSYMLYVINLIDGTPLIKKEVSQVTQIQLHPSMNYIAYIQDGSTEVIVEEFAC